MGAILGLAIFCALCGTAIPKNSKQCKQCGNFVTYVGPRFKDLKKAVKG